MEINEKQDSGTTGSSSGLTSRRFTATSLMTLLVVISGVFSLLMSQWNQQQISTILQWAAEKEGHSLHTRLIHESSLSPMMIRQNPELLQEAIASEPEILAAGVMAGNHLIASFSKSDVNFDLSNLPADREALLLDDNLTLFRRQAGPNRGNSLSGHGGGRKLGPGRGNGQGNGYGRMLSLDSTDLDGNARLSIYFVFKGPDKSVVYPLILQKYLWPVLWLAFSALWTTILLMQARNARLEVLLQKKSHLSDIGKMSARLAHEIKNPLGAIRGMAQMLQKKLKTTPDYLPMAETIEQETFRLEELTRSILDFSRPQECVLLPVDLAAISRDTLNMFNQQFPEKCIKDFTAGKAMLCAGDENAIRQILLNLLKNAVEAAPEASAIRLEIVDDEDQIVLKLFNPGSNLTEQMLEDIFTPFVSTKVKGYGLGLPVSRKLAELMGGTLRLKNASPGVLAAELRLNKEVKQ